MHTCGQKFTLITSNQQQAAMQNVSAERKNTLYDITATFQTRFIAIEF